ncbi:MAG TPA: tetratricopeptide repeat protein [Pirellulales bacterium]|nr:tetratricopeptide repeat protein [Pirellulales bacterium]
MRHAVCESCGQEYPSKETFAAFGRTLCKPCAEAAVNGSQQGFNAGDIVRNTDPTVCEWCGADFGDSELNRLGNAPTCEPCEHFLRHRPFPRWIKVSFAVLVALAALSLLKNYRFLEARMKSKEGQAAFYDGDFAIAAKRLREAAARAPESPNYGFQAEFYKAVSLMAADKPQDALPLLVNFQSEAPNEPTLQRLIFSAQLDAEFQEYGSESMLKMAELHFDESPADASAETALAWANACRYAETGQDQYHAAAAKILQNGRDEARSQHDLLAYGPRTVYCLKTRERLSQSQFWRRFSPKSERKD